MLPPRFINITANFEGICNKFEKACDLRPIWLNTLLFFYIAFRFTERCDDRGEGGGRLKCLDVLRISRLVGEGGQ
jgi:hypothetical protein